MIHPYINDRLVRLSYSIPLSKYDDSNLIALEMRLLDKMNIELSWPSLPYEMEGQISIDCELVYMDLKIVIYPHYNNSGWSEEEKIHGAHCQYYRWVYNSNDATTRHEESDRPFETFGTVIGDQEFEPFRVIFECLNGRITSDQTNQELEAIGCKKFEGKIIHRFSGYGNIFLNKDGKPDSYEDKVLQSCGVK